MPILPKIFRHVIYPEHTYFFIWPKHTAFSFSFLPFIKHSFKLFLAVATFCPLLLTFANSFDPDQARHNLGPDLDPNCLTLIFFPKGYFGEKKMKKVSRGQQNHEKLPNMQWIFLFFNLLKNPKQMLKLIDNKTFTNLRWKLLPIWTYGWDIPFLMWNPIGIDAYFQYLKYGKFYLNLPGFYNIGAKWRVAMVTLTHISRS